VTGEFKHFALSLYRHVCNVAKSVDTQPQGYTHKDSSPAVMDVNT
jgi:hypothetical protein